MSKYELLTYCSYAILMLFSGWLAFGMYVIAHFYYLRITGTIRSGWQIWASSYDYEANEGRSADDIEKLKYGKSIYFIMMYSLLAIMPLMIVWGLWIEPKLAALESIIVQQKMIIMHKMRY